MSLVRFCAPVLFLAAAFARAAHAQITLVDVQLAIVAVDRLRGTSEIDATLEPAAPVSARLPSAGDAELTALAKCKALGSLEIYEAGKITARGVAALKSLPRLQRLILGRTTLGDSSAPAFAAIPVMKVLHLAESRFTDAGMPALAKSKTLETLELSDAKLTDRGAVALTGLATLQELNLSGTRLTDAGLAKLAGLPALKQVRAIRTEVTRDGAEAAEKAKPGLGVRY